MLRMNDWMRLWGLDPKTGWPVVWQLWWPWTQPFVVTKTHIKVAMQPVAVANELQKPMLKAEIVEVDEVLQLGEEAVKEVLEEPAVAQAPVKKTIPRKRTPKVKAVAQAPLDLVTEELAKPQAVVKKTRAKKSTPIAAITPVKTATVLPQPTETPVIVPDAPQKLAAPVMVSVADSEEEVVQASVAQAQDAAQKVVAEEAVTKK